MKVEIVPPVTVTSAAVKSAEDSLSVKVRVVVSPLLRRALLEVMATVGSTVSMEIEGASDPVTLPLPAASVKALAVTEMTPGAVELAVGVNVAEYAVPEPVKPDSVPPVTVTSLDVKVVDVSLSVKMIVAVSPPLRAAAVVEIETVGAIVSIEIGVASAPAMLPFPAPSENDDAATERDPVAVEFAVGVNVAA